MLWVRFSGGLLGGLVGLAFAHASYALLVAAARRVVTREAAIGPPPDRLNDWFRSGGASAPPSGAHERAATKPDGRTLDPASAAEHANLRRPDETVLRGSSGNGVDPLARPMPAPPPPGAAAIDYIERRAAPSALRIDDGAPSPMLRPRLTERATLEHFRGSRLCARVELVASFGVCTVGSGPESNIQLDDPGLDPEHLVFGNDAGKWWVALSGGARSASADGQKLTGKPHWMLDGSSIKVGPSTLVLRTEGR